jgi:nucleoside-diphosphate-sugar epimerase
VAKAAIDEAIKSGVKHIFYSSLAFGGDGNPTSVTQVMAAHLSTERYLAQVQQQNPSSFSYTAVREGLYSESYPIYTAFFDINDPPASGEIRIPHDGSGPGISWAKRDELGEATARLIVRYLEAGSPASFPWLNKIIVLSGPHAYSLGETADVFARVLGKPIKIVETSVDDYVQQPQVKSGLDYGSGDWARLWATAFEGIRRSEANVVNAHLRDLLGREPEDFKTTIRNSLKSGKKEQ